MYGFMSKYTGIKDSRKLAIFCLILFFGTLLRLYSLTHQSFWFDEVYIANNVSQDLFSNSIRLWYEENHPPFYIIVLKVWATIFGYTDWSLRSFSVFLGVLSLFYLFRLVKILANDRVAMISLALFAISPIAIYYSQEVRYYALWLPLGMASFYYFFLWFEEGENSFIPWTLTTVLALYTHIFSVFILFIQFVLFVRKATMPKDTRYFWGSLVTIGLSVLPLMWWVVIHMGNAAGFAKPFSIVHFPYVLFAWLFGYSFGPSINELHILSFSKVLFGYGMILSLSLFLILLTLFAGIWSGWKNERVKGVVILSAICLMIIVTSPLYSNITFNVRSTLFLIPFYYLLLGLGIEYIFKSRFLRIIPILVVALMLVSLYNYYHLPKYARDDLRSLSKVLQSSMNLPVLATPMCSKKTLRYYYDNTDQEYKSFNWDAILELERETKFWVVWNRMWMFKHEAAFRRYFRDNYRVLHEDHFPGINVQLVEAKPKY